MELLRQINRCSVYQNDILIGVLPSIWVPFVDASVTKRNALALVSTEYICGLSYAINLLNAIPHRQILSYLKW